MAENVSEITCRKCETKIASTLTRCLKCGTPTSTLGLFCPKPDCRKPVEPDWDVCRSCKTKLYGSPSFGENDTHACDDGYDAVTNSENQTASSLKIALPVGEELDDQYKILKKLDDGGFGSVYEVEDTKFGGKKALKVVVAGDDNITCVPETLRQEFATHSEIAHTDHVVKAEGPRFCRYSGLSLVIVPMELADGGDMKQWLARNQSLKQRLTVGLDYFRQACLGVQAVHQAGIAHLDIKPGNILLVGATAKIADFGIGRYCSDQFARNVDALLRRGQGTPEYMSPEQFRAPRPQEVGPASDIYSLGIILFEILDGSRPFIGIPLELQDAHLNMEPPHLKGECEKWSLIVGQCLKKKAQERYPSVELLIADLDRVAEGIAVKVDVSCRNPECRHTNVLPHMINVNQCERCGRPLPDSFFRECPGFGKVLRCDIEVCPFCNRKVEEYYRLIEQRDRIEQVKDEDPVTAIELLNDITTYFSTHGDEINFHQRAIVLLNDLEKKQPQIGDLIQQARKAESNHEPNQAIQFWQEILTIIPRHRTAKKEIQRIGANVDAFFEDRKRALHLANQAEFDKAESLLEGCDKRIPDYQQIRQTLTLCRQRAGAFAHARQQMEKTLEDKQLNAALESVEEGLSVAPGCETFITLKTDLSERIVQVQRRVVEIQQRLNEGEVAWAESQLNEIEVIQTDNELAVNLREQIAELYHQCEECFSDAQTAFRQHCLSKAASCAKQALEYVPESSQTQDLLEQIEDCQKQVTAKVDQAKEELASAEFEKAHQHLSQAGDLWDDMPDLKQAVQLLEEKQPRYMELTEKIQNACQAGQLDAAFEDIQQLLAVCPKTQQAEVFRKDIQNRQQQARLCLQQSFQYLTKANFDQALNLFKEAQALWSAMPELTNSFKKLGDIKEKYESAMERAQRNMTSEKLDAAVQHAQTAVELCPDSPLAQERLGQIQQKQLEMKLLSIDEKIASADFDAADTLIQEVCQLFPGDKKVDACQNRLTKVRKPYEECMKGVKASITLHNYEHALSKLEEAQTLCPASPYPQKMIGKIQGIIRRKAILRKIVAKTLIWSVIMAMLFVGGRLLLEELPGPGLWTFCLALLAVGMNMTFRTGLYKSARHFLSVTNHLEIFCLVFGLICLLSGIVFEVFPEQQYAIYLPLVLVGYSLIRPVLILITKILLFIKWVVTSRVFIVSCVTIMVLAAVGWGGNFIFQQWQEYRIENEANKKAAMASMPPDTTGQNEVSDIENKQITLSQEVVPPAAETIKKDEDVPVISTKVIEADNIKNKKLQEQQAIQNNFDRLAAAAQAQEASGQLIEAKNSYRQALAIMNDEPIRAKTQALEQKLNDYQNYLDQGHQAARNLADVGLAMDMYQKAQSLWNSPEVDRAIQALNEQAAADISNTLAKAQGFMDQSQPEAAYALVEQSLAMANMLDLSEQIRQLAQLQDQIQWKINPGALSWKRIATEQIDTVDDHQQARKTNVRFYTNSIGMKFTHIETGHYYISATEVTHAQWQALMGDGPDWFTGDTIPVCGISWNDALAFCEKLSETEGLQYHLPTVKQWKQASACGLDTPFACGDIITEQWANFSPSPGDSVAPKTVCSYPANRWGVYDMHGNVSEWCRDKKTPRTAVLMGGSYRSPADRLRIEYLETDSVNAKNKSYGFRVVIELKE